MRKLVIATRGSQLALAQAEWVAETICVLNPGTEVDLSVIKTQGDKILDVPLAKVGGKGLFVKEIEDALLSGQADLAVHSMKDVPAELPPGLMLAAITEREDERDVLVGRSGITLDELPWGARIGTSSLRRAAQLLAARPDLEIVSIRGNVQTRLRKLEELDLQGIVLAEAGLSRLGMDDLPRQRLEPNQMLPAVGQGALGVEMRSDDAELLEMVRKLDHAETAAAVRAERAFLARLEGGCQVPIAGHAVVRDGLVRFQGMVAALDGSRLIRGDGVSGPMEAAEMGRRVAEQVLEQGGREILAQVYGEAPA